MKFFRPIALMLPASAGLATALVIGNLVADIPVIYFRADVATLLLFVGFGLSLVAVAGIYVIDQFESQKTLVQEKVQTQAADERRRFLRRLDHELKNPLTAIRAGLANIL